jgi:catechol 2,3-dioxygenase-like lactoylglutathione lyase family enzyme
MSESKSTINIRYIVHDVDEAIRFYTEALGFEVVMHPAPGFAALSKDGVTLFVNEPGVGGAGQAMPDGTLPQPGGWNRFQIIVEDVDAEVERLKKLNVHFKTGIIEGKGGRQVLLEDPSGNIVELFAW